MIQLKPEPHEGASKYTTKVRKAGNECNFSNWLAEKMIKYFTIANMLGEELQFEIFQKEHTQDEIIDTCQKKEDIVAQSKIMHGLGRSTENVKHRQRWKNKDYKLKEEAHVVIVGVKLTTTKVSAWQMGEHATIKRNEETLLGGASRNL